MDKKEFTGPLYDLDQLDEAINKSETNSENTTEINDSQHSSINNFDKETPIDTKTEKNKAKKILIGAGSAALVGVVLVGSAIGINTFGNSKEAAAETPTTPNRTESTQTSHQENKKDNETPNTNSDYESKNDSDKETIESGQNNSYSDETIDSNKSSYETETVKEFSISELEAMSLDEFEDLPQEIRIKGALGFIDSIVKSQMYRELYKKEPEYSIVPMPDSIDNTALEVVNNNIYRKQIACAAFKYDGQNTAVFDFEKGSKVTSAAFDSIYNDNGELVSLDYDWLIKKMKEFTLPTLYKEKVVAITNESGLIDIVQEDQNNKTTKGMLVEYLTDTDLTCTVEYVYVQYGDSPKESIWLENKTVDDYNEALQNRISN